ncbi:hypothetical protein BB561_001598 [Smittium simulii]|uniref:HMG box domain-containing protein n=1 Tax=Smittium simulii TaxID=133385 RepID=A0A2T9YTY0_9FUNG|nr:hypothetical protein BB561_001598 [Smittium simulii]
MKKRINNLDKSQSINKSSNPQPTIKILPKCKKLIYQQTEMYSDIKAVTACNPAEFVFSDGKTYIEKIPGHYVLFIPNSIQKEDIVRKIQKIERKKPAKKRPTRAHNSFILYRTDMAKNIRKQNSHLNQKEVSKIIANMWNNEKSSVREKYKLIYEKKKMEYKNIELGLSLPESANASNPNFSGSSNSINNSQHLCIILKDYSDKMSIASTQNATDPACYSDSLSMTKSDIPLINDIFSSPLMAQFLPSVECDTEYHRLNKELQRGLSGETNLTNFLQNDNLTINNNVDYAAYDLSLVATNAYNNEMNKSVSQNSAFFNQPGNSNNSLDLNVLSSQNNPEMVFSLDNSAPANHILSSVAGPSYSNHHLYNNTNICSNQQDQSQFQMDTQKQLSNIFGLTNFTNSGDFHEIGNETRVENRNDEINLNGSTYGQIQPQNSTNGAIISFLDYQAMYQKNTPHHHLGNNMEQMRHVQLDPLNSAQNNFSPFPVENNSQYTHTNPTHLQINNETSCSSNTLQFHQGNHFIPKK